MSNKYDHRRSTAMRKLIESTLVSLEGVIESPEEWAIFGDEATQRSMHCPNTSPPGPSPR